MHLIHHQINALNEIQFMASIKLLNVSAPGAILRECKPNMLIKLTCWAYSHLF